MVCIRQIINRWELKLRSNSLGWVGYCSLPAKCGNFHNNYGFLCSAGK